MLGFKLKTASCMVITLLSLQFPKLSFFFSLQLFPTMNLFFG